MKQYKKSENIEFDVKYDDGSSKHVQEGILFEFNEEKIDMHLGTSRKECIFATVEALMETINDMELVEEFLSYVGCEEVQNE